jgi:hypothetical protein
VQWAMAPLEYANLIAQKSSLRKEALVQYRMLLVEKPGQTKIRLKYAALLSAEKKDLNPAIVQYKLILKKNHRHVAAHQGLAHVYAWNGDGDRAVYHSNLALKYQPNNSNASRLKTQMMKGREPKLITELSFFNQDGDDANYDMAGMIFKSGCRADLNPFITGQADIGYEKFWKQAKSMDGKMFNFELNYRPDASQTISGSVNFHLFNGADDASEFDIRYLLKKPTYTISSGIKRSLRYDSLLALGSYDAYNPANTPMGAARSNMLYCQLATTKILNSSYPQIHGHPKVHY